MNSSFAASGLVRHDGARVAVSVVISRPSRRRENGRRGEKKRVYTYGTFKRIPFLISVLIMAFRPVLRGTMRRRCQRPIFDVARGVVEGVFDAKETSNRDEICFDCIVYI